MTRASVFTFLCFIPVLALAAACGGGDDGEPGGASLPEGFPEDLPLYEKATIQVATVHPEGAGFLVSMESEDSTDKVLAFYENELDKEPWQVENVVEIAEQETVIVEFARQDSPEEHGTLAIAAVHVDGQLSSISLQLFVAP
ncbi:MAG: hypothetical protein AMJ77_02975 [Dehalococcoidia bacterium SM23_28_2]|nr:MAG: hypothetical protein AMJ77_02975 [Dehalococcoidia bacterium SM23_28_2]